MIHYVCNLYQSIWGIILWAVFTFTMCCDPDLCGGRGDWSTPLREKPLRIAALLMFPLGYAVCIIFTHWVSLV